MILVSDGVAHILGLFSDTFYNTCPFQINLQSLEYALAEKSLGQNILAHFLRRIKPFQKIIFFWNALPTPTKIYNTNNLK